MAKSPLALTSPLALGALVLPSPLALSQSHTYNPCAVSCGPQFAPPSPPVGPDGRIEQDRLDENAFHVMKNIAGNRPDMVAQYLNQRHDVNHALQVRSDEQEDFSLYDELSHRCRDENVPCIVQRYFWFETYRQSATVFPLIVAAAFGRTDVLNQLVCDPHIDLDQQNDLGETALYNCCRE